METNPSSSTPSIPESNDLTTLISSIPNDLKNRILKMALFEICQDKLLRFQAVVHWTLGDQALMPDLLHPRYPYMGIINPLLYSFPPPVLCLIGCLLACHTVAIQLQTRYIRRLLRFEGGVHEAQMNACTNCMRFLQWLLPLDRWRDHVAEKSSAIIVIASRKPSIKSDGQVDYEPVVLEVIPITTSLYGPGRQWTDTMRYIKRSLWSLNNGDGSWRADWDNGVENRPWKKFPVEYAAKAQQNMQFWYQSLDIFHIMLKWRKSPMVRAFEMKYNRLQQFNGIQSLLPNVEPIPETWLPAGTGDEDD